MEQRTSAFRRLSAFLALALLAALLTTLGGTTSAGALPQSDVVIAAGKTAQSTSHLASGSASHTFLTNTANFGPAGTVEVDSLTINADAATIDASYLSGVHIYFDGWIWDSTHTPDTPIWGAGEISALDTWVMAGGVIIVNDDFANADELSAHFGATLGAAADDATYTITNPTHPIVDGPFGTTGNQTACGTAGHFGTLSAPWEVVATAPGANAAIAVRPWGDGWVILTGDEGLFRDAAPCTADTTFIGNVFAFAHSLTDDGVTALSLDDPGDQASTVGVDIGTLQLTTSGGDASTITFSDSLGPLPAGLTLDTATGAITGTPSAAGTTNVTLSATDNTGTSSVTIEWVVSAVDLMPVAVADEGEGTVGDEFSLDLCDNDTLGDGVNTASVSAGTLPPGLDISVCTLSGTPTEAGATQFSYILTDADGDMSAAATVDIVITAAAVVTCNGQEATMVGTSGDDVLMGTPGPDVIHGLGGNDEIHGLGGDDLICGGGGSDDLRGNGGNDTIFGNAGGDTIFGNRGGDTIVGGKGADTIFGNNGEDNITGNGGGDTISGGKKADSIFGNNGEDTISGGAGGDTIGGGKKADIIFGNNGADILSGGGGDDTLSGGKKADIISGNNGTDTCSGGAGIDVFNSCEL